MLLLVSITLYYYCTISFSVVNHFFIFLCITQSTTRCSLLLFQSAVKRKDSLQRNRQVVAYYYFKVRRCCGNTYFLAGLVVTYCYLKVRCCNLLLSQGAVKQYRDKQLLDQCCNLLLSQGAVKLDILYISTNSLPIAFKIRLNNDFFLGCSTGFSCLACSCVDSVHSI